MKRNALLICLLLSLPGLLFAQRTATQTAKPAFYTLVVQTQPANASVSVDGALLKGNAATNLAAGSHSVLVQARGYLDYNTVVSLTGNMSISVSLQPAAFQLSVNAANVRGAEVIINGNPAGQTPFSAQLAPGSYMVTIRAPGYGDYSIQLNMNGPQSISAVLQPLAATWQLSLPDSSVNKDMRGGHWNQIQVYIDGAVVRGTQGQFFPGRHTVRVVSGGLAAETFIDAQAGQVYTIEPVIGINIR